jgi:hypothetical protein
MGEDARLIKETAERGFLRLNLMNTGGHCIDLASLLYAACPIGWPTAENPDTQLAGLCSRGTFQRHTAD